MLGNDPRDWRRALKALVAGLDPAVAVRIGREDTAGHHPVRLTLRGCQETMRFYEDQIAALPTDEAARASILQELKEAIALLQLKAQTTRVL